MNNDQKHRNSQKVVVLPLELHPLSPLLEVGSIERERLLVQKSRLDGILAHDDARMVLIGCL